MNSSSEPQSSAEGPPEKCNLYCSQCSSQIGVFDNEWIRLTASYARFRRKGTHYNSEIGQRTQIVPSGTTQKAAEGCVMSEIFCKTCSATLGQYCRGVPDAEKQHLVDQYFYRLSRVVLKDARTLTQIEPSFGYGGDLHQSGSRANSLPRKSLLTTQRSSQTPFRQNYTPLRTQMAQKNALNIAAQRRHEEGLSASTEIDLDDPMTTQVLDHELKIIRLENKLAEQARRSVAQSAQIAQLTTQLLAFRNTLDQFQGSLNSVRSQQAVDSVEEGPDQGSSSSVEPTLMDPNIDAVRQENEMLKAALNNIASMIGSDFDASLASEAAREDLSDKKTKILEILGKRKRHDDVARPQPSQLQEDLELRQERIRAQNNDNGRSAEASCEKETSTEISVPIQIASEEMATARTEQSFSEVRENSETPQLPTSRSIVPSGSEHNRLADTSIQQTTNEQNPEVEVNTRTNFSAVEDIPIDPRLLNGNSTMDNIDFSDEEANDNSRADAENATGDERESSTMPDSADNQISAPKRGRPKKSIPLKDYNVRSMAPEPPKRRRTMVRLDKPRGLDNVQLTTPKSWVQQIEDKGKPRVPKPRMQTTEKLLNKELEELGLSEWIGKDKKSGEYRAAVNAARARQREALKLSKLNERGFGPSKGDSEQGNENLALLPPPPPPPPPPPAVAVPTLPFPQPHPAPFSQPVATPSSLLPSYVPPAMYSAASPSPIQPGAAAPLVYSRPLASPAPAGPGVSPMHARPVGPLVYSRPGAPPIYSVPGGSLSTSGVVSSPIRSASVGTPTKSGNMAPAADPATNLSTMKPSGIALSKGSTVSPPPSNLSVTTPPAANPASIDAPQQPYSSLPETNTTGSLALEHSAAVELPHKSTTLGPPTPSAMSEAPTRLAVVDQATNPTTADTSVEETNVTTPTRSKAASIESKDQHSSKAQVNGDENASMPLTDITNQRRDRPTEPNDKKAAQPAAARMTTRKQQREEIRKRDQMAKRAMELQEAA